MRAVGLNPDNGTGKKSDAYRLRQQMERLFASHMTFQATIENDHVQGTRRKDMSVTSESELWWDVKRPKQGALWQSWIELGEKFYEAITTEPVPFDLRALKMLRRSPLALDLYAWVCYRVFPIVRRNQPPQFVAWTMLMRQLGTGFKDVKDFKKKVKPALRKVRLAYPGLAIEMAKGGFTIHASRLAVPSKTPVQTAGET